MHLLLYVCVIVIDTPALGHACACSTFPIRLPFILNICRQADGEYTDMADRQEGLERDGWESSRQPWQFEVGEGQGSAA